jgi:hypothetical protein
VAALLDNNEIGVRLNGAVILAGMAQAGGSSPELLKALKRCVADSSPAIAHWGMQGIMDNPAFPPEDKVDALAQCVDVSRPRPLRVAAALAAIGDKVTQAVPTIIKYLASVSEDYRNQVQATLAPAQSSRVDVGAGGAAVVGAAAEKPGYAIVGGAPSGGGPAGPAGRPGPGAGIIGGQSRRSPIGGGGAPGAGIIGRSGGGGMAAQPPGGFGAGRPPSAIGAAGRQQPAVAVKPAEQIDPSKLDPQEQEQLIAQLENLPTVQEIHHVGLALDGLMKLSVPEAHKTFEFDTTPPWALDSCVDNAVKWLAENEEIFKPGAAVPAPAAAAAPAPAPAPAAPAAVPAAPAPGKEAAGVTPTTLPAAPTGAAPGK